MDSVAFLQQEVASIDRQIAQLNDKREELLKDISAARYQQSLRKYNLPKQDVPV